MNVLGERDGIATKTLWGTKSVAQTIMTSSHVLASGKYGKRIPTILLSSLTSDPMFA